MQNNFGPIALLGSGETSLAGGRVFENIGQRFSSPLRIAILETPAGFELNSPRVAGRVGDFLKTRLQNFLPRIDIIPARRRDTPFNPDNPDILAPLLQADIIFMGPGSPTYAIRQLQGSLAWDLLRARHAQGAALVFASAAVISVGARALPVYEIYKVGEDITILPALDLFAAFNLQLSFIPHWNNTDGGDEVDTSRCFVGIERFTQWCNMLPAGHTTIGLDEHTGLIIDFRSKECNVSGVSSVTLSRECNPKIFPSGACFPITELGDFRLPEDREIASSVKALQLIENAAQPENSKEISADVAILVEERVQARIRQDWAKADSLRQRIAELGWTVMDTPEGQKVVRQLLK